VPLRRHDLLRTDAAVWDAMLAHESGLADQPLIANWARLGWPAIVRRLAAGETANGTPVGLPLPPSHGKRRIALSVPAGAAVVELPPLLLHEAASGVPAAWESTIVALLEVAEAAAVSPRVVGSLLWEHVTGLRYLTAQSDLDLVWPVPDESTATALVQSLLWHDTGAPVRLDGDLELPDGAGVNWREFARVTSNGGDVLVKTTSGVEMRPASALFRIPA
jgi:phosphoribosyl-dephospho-CoA transferase